MQTTTAPVAAQEIDRLMYQIAKLATQAQQYEQRVTRTYKQIAVLYVEIHKLERVLDAHE